MSCPCIQSAPINSCTEQLTVGVIDEALTEVSVFLKNNSTGKITQFDTISGVDGEVVIDTDEFNFGTSMGYEITISLLNEPMSETIEFTSGDQTGSCIWFMTVDIEGGSTIQELTAIGETVGPSTVRYKEIGSDYTWPGSVYTVAVIDSSSVVTATLAAPSDFTKGQDYTFKDLSGAASLNNPILVGPFEDGSAFKSITSDLGSITFQTNGVDKFFLTSEI